MAPGERQGHPGQKERKHRSRGRRQTGAARGGARHDRRGLVDRDECGRGIARSAAETARIGLASEHQWTPNRRPVASSTICAAARTARFVLRRPHVLARHLDGISRPSAPLRPQRVGQAHEAEQRLDAVVAVRLSRQHPEEQVQLGVRLDGDGRPGSWTAGRSQVAQRDRRAGERPGAEQHDRQESGGVVGDGIRGCQPVGHAETAPARPRWPPRTGRESPA